LVGTLPLTSAQGARGKEELNYENRSAGPLDFTRTKGQVKPKKIWDTNTKAHVNKSGVVARDYCIMNHNTNALVLQECETLLNTVYV